MLRTLPPFWAAIIPPATAPTTAPTIAVTTKNGQHPSGSIPFIGLFRQYAYALCPITPWPATTGAVVAGGGTLAATASADGVGAGAAYVANNLAQAANNITPAAQTVASKMQDVATKGKNGELLSGLVKNTTRIPSLTGTAAYRIPDGLDMSIKVLSEVKNYTGKLSYTSQLKDFVMWSQANGFEMHLYTNAILIGPLQKIVDSGIIKLFPLK